MDAQREAPSWQGRPGPRIPATKGSPPQWTTLEACGVHGRQLPDLAVVTFRQRRGDGRFLLSFPRGLEGRGDRCDWRRGGRGSRGPTRTHAA